jgi:flagellar basal body-associated protein FliL
MNIKPIRHHKTKQEKKKLFMTLFIVIIMISSIAGFAITNYTSMSSVRVNGKKFFYNNGLWQTNVNFYDQPLTLKTTILPNETIHVPDIEFNDFKDKTVYVAINPDFQAYNLQLFLQLISRISLRMQQVCLPSWNFTFCQQVPIKECPVSSEHLMIIFDKSEKPNIVTFNSCLTVNANIDNTENDNINKTNNESAINEKNEVGNENKIVDSLLFKLFNIV